MDEQIGLVGILEIGERELQIISYNYHDPLPLSQSPFRVSGIFSSQAILS